MPSSNNNAIDMRLEAHKKALKQLDGHKVEAGWFESARYKAAKNVPESQVGMPIAQVAFWNEHGTTRTVEETGPDGKTITSKVVHIPARPFMRFAMALFNRDRASIQKSIAKKIIDGKISPLQGLGQIGNALEGKIVLSIKTGPWPKNADSTVARKGFDAPLRDTAQMFKTVSSKVS
jgi:hypothetical protein